MVLSGVMNANPIIPEDLLKRVEQAALAQSRDPSAVIEEAVRRYLDDRSWMEIFAYGRERAEASGLRDETAIDAAIADWRSANR